MAHTNMGTPTHVSDHYMGTPTHAMGTFYCRVIVKVWFARKSIKTNTLEEEA
jgi:hypothetical protein